MTITAETQPKASPAALAYGRQTARKLLSGRTGHGGGPCSYRQLNEAELAAPVALAFDAGRAS